MSMCIGTKITK